MIFQSVEALVLGNVSLYGGIAICIYAAMGILRCPGQSLFHMLLSFMIGPAVGVPVSLLVRPPPIIAAAFQFRVAPAG